MNGADIANVLAEQFLNTIKNFAPDVDPIELLSKFIKPDQTNASEQVEEEENQQQEEDQVPEIPEDPDEGFSIDDLPEDPEFIRSEFETITTNTLLDSDLDEFAAPTLEEDSSFQQLAKKYGIDLAFRASYREIKRKMQVQYNIEPPNTLNLPTEGEITVQEEFFVPTINSTCRAGQKLKVAKELIPEFRKDQSFQEQQKSIQILRDRFGWTTNTLKNRLQGFKYYTSWFLSKKKQLEEQAGHKLRVIDVTAELLGSCCAHFYFAMGFRYNTILIIRRCTISFLKDLGIFVCQDGHSRRYLSELFTAFRQTRNTKEEKTNAIRSGDLFYIKENIDMLNPRLRRIIKKLFFGFACASRPFEIGCVDGSCIDIKSVMLQRSESVQGELAVITFPRDKVPDRDGEACSIFPHIDRSKCIVNMLVEHLQENDFFESKNALDDRNFNIKESMKDQLVFPIVSDPNKPTTRVSLQEEMETVLALAGYAPNSFSGYSLRRGFVTEYFEQLLRESGGVFTDSMYTLLLDHVGWAPSSKAARGYMNETSKQTVNPFSVIDRSSLPDAKYVVEQILQGSKPSTQFMHGDIMHFIRLVVPDDLDMDEIDFDPYEDAMKNEPGLITMKEVFDEADWKDKTKKRLAQSIPIRERMIKEIIAVCVYNKEVITKSSAQLTDQEIKNAFKCYLSPVSAEGYIQKVDIHTLERRFRKGVRKADAATENTAVVEKLYLKRDPDFMQHFNEIVEQYGGLFKATPTMIFNDLDRDRFCNIEFTNIVSFVRDERKRQRKADKKKKKKDADAEESSDEESATKKKVPPPKKANVFKKNPEFMEAFNKIVYENDGISNVTATIIYEALDKDQFSNITLTNIQTFVKSERARQKKKGHVEDEKKKSETRSKKKRRVVEDDEDESPKKKKKQNDSDVEV